MGIWLKRLSYLALAGFPLAVLGMRLNLFDFGVSFNLIKYTLFLSIGVFFVGLLTALLLRGKDSRQSRAALMAAALCVIPLLGIGSQINTGRSLPQIHNISTDVVNPPQFDVISSIRSADDNPLAYDAAKLAEVQQQAYPEVKTLLASMTPAEAHARALTVAKELGWEIVNEDTSTGIIEATQTTALWGFKDDIVVRIQPQANQVAIDLRSVSRIGRSDLGANAKRIHAFLDAFGRN